jgi:hypothetical protein
MMLFHFFIEILEHPQRADESAMGGINRPLLISFDVQEVKFPRGQIHVQA